MIKLARAPVNHSRRRPKTSQRIDTVRYAQPIKPRIPHHSVRNQVHPSNKPRNGNSVACGSPRKIASEREQPYDSEAL